MDDYVNCGNDGSLKRSNTDFTIEAWIKLNGYSSSWVEAILSNRISGGGVGSLFFVRGEKDALNTRKVTFDTSVGTESGPPRMVFGITQLQLNQWYHVVATFQYKGGDANEVTIFVNGVAEDTATLRGIGSPDTQPTWIGWEPSQNVDYDFNGIIDEVRIYNRALTADEIMSHYEGKQTALTLTKSPSPHSIKQGQTTTVTLTVKNTGTTEITDIEVSDTIPTGLFLVSGETSKKYTSLIPKDSREFQYVLQPSDVGTFNLDTATATYSDEEGNYHTVESKTAAITVIPSPDRPTAPQTVPKSSTEISTASVHLHGEKTDVVMSEEVLLKLSAVNIIGNPLMHVQVIIIPPSGWSVTSSEFAKSGAGQYTTTYDIESGVGRDIEVRIIPNQIGDDFQVQGRIIYYFGDDSDTRDDHTLTLPITVRAEAKQAAGTSESEGQVRPDLGRC
ncbi:MAG: LamG-like jellyroll fold domain-containing protein [Euryarchaeota archaeon]|nr:LamG-like jellyroll fold domain-containing protein [Euryarchaeota archaeon]